MAENQAKKTNQEIDANIDPKLLKPYSPQETEDRLYKLWLDSGFFNPDVCVEKGVIESSAPTFSMVLPPPNVTGVLHVGHALVLTIEDIMARYARMNGKKTLWLPGTDHAAIATQVKVEEKLYKEEEKTRFDFSREDFLKKVDAFAQDSHDTITNQVKKMGASVDWSREAYTLDSVRQKAVRTAFKRMYDAGLIYQGHRIVNWDPKLKTTVSDVEIDWVEEKVPFYYIKYGPFTIATARPETKFGDKYVVMHPDDKRYAQYTHGQQLEVPWINGTITATIIKDESVDMEFGTGVMTITPWHDQTDFDIAERHGLDKEQIIDFDGKLLAPVAGEFAGTYIKKARPLIVEKLQNLGLIEKIDENYVHNIAKNSRGGGVIEPQIKKQWFIAVNKPFTMGPSKISGIKEGDTVTLKQLMKAVVDNGQIEIVPDRFAKIYSHWTDNLRDWCISRQIWFGHRIPVWYRGKKLEDGSFDASAEMYCGLEAPEGAEPDGTTNGGWEQDSDTLDTWFSSGLWTFSTLGWPDETPDFKTYHPTTMLETAYDILPFWVARMILMSTYLLGNIPFKTVYIHGLVLDGKGRKMSKSLGNSLDPLLMIEKFGTDATRLALIIGTGPGNDSKFSEEKARGYKHFANKIWNITRFVLSSTIDLNWAALGTTGVDSAVLPSYTTTDQKVFDDFAVFMKEVNTEMENYRYHLAAEKLYHYMWHTFADVVIEDAKKKLASTDATERASAQRLLAEILVSSLKMLHPFIPFVTEEIWSLMPIPNKQLLIVEKWPK
jgi:valyl-tRNA synthetase